MVSLVITGTMGSGKTTVLAEASDLLRITRIWLPFLKIIGALASDGS